MSTPKAQPRRPYCQRARAEAQELTRRRIAEAAVELHGTIGPGRTTISAVADRAGVERATVYRHFPDERALFTACSRRYFEDHPQPDLAKPMTIADPVLRTEAVLITLYTYYREIAPMMSSLLRDAPVVPLLAEYFGPYVTMLSDLADALASTWPGASDARRLRAAIGHALAFPTWQSLAGDQGLTDPESVEMMLSLLNGVGRPLRS